MCGGESIEICDRRFGSYVREVLASNVMRPDFVVDRAETLRSSCLEETCYAFYEEHETLIVRGAAGFQIGAVVPDWLEARHGVCPYPYPFV